MSDFLPVRRESAAMRTRDGVRLDADIWRPDGPGPYPVLLMRQPYGRSIASTVVYAHPSWYARHGYIAVIQDVRGRGTSDGEFRIIAQEFADGYDTVDWASRLPGSTGVVGMYGFSYQAASQLLAAASGHPALKTICPAMGPYDTYADMGYEGGSFRLFAGLGWGLQLAAETARRAGDVEAHQALVAAARAQPLHEAVPAMPAVMRRYGSYGHYVDWITHPRPGALWDLISPRHYAAQVRLPALHIGGWYDGILTGTLSGYRDMAGRRDVGLQNLVVGPWIHIPWSTKVGDIEFGPAAANEIDHLQLRWFDQFLKGADTGLLKDKPVRLFEMGGTWRDFAAWPDGEKRALHFTSRGRAGLDAQDGRLADAPAEAGEDVIVFDPWRPTPSAGGHAAYPLGPMDRRSVDGRSDVLTYTTPMLTEDIHLAGDVAAELFVTADQPSFDLSVVLAEVRQDGRVFNLTEGYARIDDGRSPIKVTMRATCAKLARGAALRISVAAGSFPAHPVNPGDGSPAAAARLIDQRIITVFVRHGAGAPSRVLLPVVPPP
jgi:putative CocE/NonD family hydrolase